MKKLLTKVVAIILVLTMSVGMFAGCGPKEPEGKTKIYFANYAVLESNYTAYWNQIEKDFEAANPEYDVEYLTAGYNDMMTYVTNRVAGGDTVDLIFGEVAWAPALAESGITSPVKDVLSDSFIKDFYEDIIGAFKYDGEYYGVPCYFSPGVLFINKDNAAKVGLDINNPPKNQAELMEWCDKLSTLKTASGEKIYPIGLPYAEKTAPGAYVNSVITAFGGQILDEKGNLSIDNKGFDEAVDFYIELNKKGYNPQNALPKDLRALFATGSLSMMIDQTGTMSALTNINSKSSEFTYLAPFPGLGTSGKGATLVQSHCFLMKDNGDASAEATRKLVEFIISKEGLGNYLQNIAPYFPSTKAMADVELSKFLDTVKDSSLNIYNQINLPETNSIHIELARMINSICTGGKSKADAIAEFKKQAEILLR